MPRQRYVAVVWYTICSRLVASVAAIPLHAPSGYGVIVAPPLPPQVNLLPDPFDGREVVFFLRPSTRRDCAARGAPARGGVATSAIDACRFVGVGGVGGGAQRVESGWCTVATRPVGSGRDTTAPRTIAAPALRSTARSAHTKK